MTELTYLQAVVIGALQGVTELFPIYSLGHSVLVPALIGASVCVYGADLHHLPLAEMTPELVADNLRGRWPSSAPPSARTRRQPGRRSTANHLLPAGSSVFHPHTPGGCHSVPTNTQAQLAGLSADRLRDYLAAKRAAGQRYIAATGQAHWLAVFAPVGPGEVHLAHRPRAARRGEPLPRGRSWSPESGWMSRCRQGCSGALMLKRAARRCC